MVAIGHTWLNHIQKLCALQLELLQQLQLVNGALGSSVLLRAGSSYWRSLKPATVAAYEASIAKFEVYLGNHQNSFVHAHELDLLMTDYVRSTHMSRAGAERLVSAVDKMVSSC